MKATICIIIAVSNGCPEQLSGYLYSHVFTVIILLNCCYGFSNYIIFRIFLIWYKRQFNEFPQFYCMFIQMCMKAILTIKCIYLIIHVFGNFNLVYSHNHTTHIKSCWFILVQYLYPFIRNSYNQFPRNVYRIVFVVYFV
jgi:hypothetical protein